MTGAPSGSSVPARDAAALALVSLPGAGPAHLRLMLDRWPNPLAAADAVAGGRAAAALSHEPPAVARALAREWARALDRERAEARIASRSAQVLLRGDPEYPLDPEVPDAPAVLVLEGSRHDAFDRPRVAVVGTRSATPHGVHDAHALGVAMAEEGVTVVSGLAIGIDGAAHRGALDGGGLTVGVVATGLDVVYPRRHGALFDRVRGGGLLVSESPYGTHPERWRFPVRNRIIAALADVVVLVEATERGGARITAEYALAYGRPVLAQPGSRRNPSAAGCNALVADGAQPLLDPSDVLIALGMTSGSRRGWGTRAARPDLDPDGARIVEALGGEPATTDQVASRTGLTPAQVAVTVARLERDGWLTRERGMLWPA